MPLSEDEQRILHEIERTFYQHDPEFAREVSATTLYRQAGRNVKFGVIGLLVGLAVLITQFAANVLLGFIGFLVMFASAIVIERNVRRMGRAGLQELRQSVGQSGWSGFVSGAQQRLRRRSDESD